MIQLRNITLGYEQQRPLLENVSYTFNRGSLYALLGRNGAGKSTLMRAIAGLEEPLQGEILINKEPMAQLSPLQRAMNIALVTTQRVRVSRLSCEALVALGRAPYTNWLGSLTSDDMRIVGEALEMVQMSHFAQKSCDTLSDGELQRVMIARAVAQQTDVIMLDEPTAFLDMPSRYDLLKLLHRLAREQHKCVIFSTHELNMALRSADEALLVDGACLHSLDVRSDYESALGRVGEIFGVDLSGV